jgi:hypothetical protein
MNEKRFFSFGADVPGSWAGKKRLSGTWPDLSWYELRFSFVSGSYSSKFPILAIQQGG